MKKCLGWHFECCARRVPTLRKSAAHRIKKRTPKLKKCVLLILSSLSPFLYFASKHRANTERRPRDDREKSNRNILQNFAFFHSPPCTFQKKVVSLPSKVQRRGLEGGMCPISESQMLTQRPQSWLSRHIKKAFIALCSDALKSRKFLIQ